MENQFIRMFIFLGAILILLVLNEFIYRKFRLNGEFTRKIAHFTASLSTIIFPFIFISHWYVFILALFFFLLLFISRIGKQLGSIHNIDRESTGSYLLPVSIYLSFLVSDLTDNKLLFLLPVLILAICDPLAGIAGYYFANNKNYIHVFGKELKKTVPGSVSFFLSCFAVSIIVLYFFRNSFDIGYLCLAAGIAIAGTLTELFSSRGFDNLNVPVSIILILLLFLKNV